MASRKSLDRYTSLKDIKVDYDINQGKKPNSLDHKIEITLDPKHRIGGAGTTQSGPKVTSRPYSETTTELATTPTSSDKATLRGPCVLAPLRKVLGTARYLDPLCTSSTGIIHRGEDELASFLYKVLEIATAKKVRMPSVLYLKRDGKTTTPSFEVALEDCSVTDPRWQLKHLVCELNIRSYSIVFKINMKLRRDLLQDLLKKLNDLAHKKYLNAQIIQTKGQQVQGTETSQTLAMMHQLATMFYKAMQNMKDKCEKEALCSVNNLKAIGNDRCELEKYEALLQKNERAFEQMKTTGEKKKALANVLKTIAERCRRDPAALQMALVLIPARFDINLASLVDN